MKIRQLITTTTTTAVLVVASPAYSQPADSTPAVDPLALKWLARAADFMAQQKQFSVSTEIWQDSLIDGVKIQSSRTAKISLRRPDRLRIDMSTTSPLRSFLYDGKTVTVVDHATDCYGQVDAAPTIDATITAAEEKHGLDFPLDDLLISRPFGDAAANAKSGRYLGAAVVLGTTCHHLAFQNEAIDWQVWIADGPVPTPRKVVINFKTEIGSPVFIALFDQWDFSTALPDFVFEFTPLASQTKVDMVMPPAPKDESDD